MGTIVCQHDRGDAAGAGRVADAVRRAGRAAGAGARGPAASGRGSRAARAWPPSPTRSSPTRCPPHTREPTRPRSLSCARIDHAAGPGRLRPDLRGAGQGAGRRSAADLGADVAVTGDADTVIRQRRAGARRQNFGRQHWAWTAAATGLLSRRPGMQPAWRFPETGRTIECDGLRPPGGPAGDGRFYGRRKRQSVTDMARLDTARGPCSSPMSASSMGPANTPTPARS